MNQNKNKSASFFIFLQQLNRFCSKLKVLEIFTAGVSLEVKGQFKDGVCLCFTFKCGM